MADYEFPPNSHKYKNEQRALAEQPKRAEKVVTGKVKTKKKSEMSKFTKAFISEDVKNVKSYVVLDVLIPAAKKLIADIVTDGIDMILYGSAGRSKRGPGSSKVSYRNYYDDRRGGSYRSEAPAARSRFDYDDLVFESRGDAEAVLDQLDEMISRYKCATVADMYDAADRTAPYTSNRYGWTNVSSAEVVRTRDGDYIIQMPRAMPID